MGAIKNTTTHKDSKVRSNENRDDAVIRLGDFVEVVGYGSLHWINKIESDPVVIDSMKVKFPVIAEDDHFLHLDMNPELVGKRGIITDCASVCNREMFILSMVDKNNYKKAWYSRDQLKKVSRL